MRKVAESFVIANYDDKSKRGWDNDTIISSIKAIFDTENNVSSYLVNLGNDGKESGYVIIAADKEEMPIIEYSTSGTAFFDEAIDESKDMAEKEHKSKVKENSTRIIDLGGHNYAVQHSFKNGKKTTYDITTKDNIKEINLENNKKENNKNKKESYTEVWNDLMERGGAYGDNSNPPDSGSKYITAPSQYESIKATSSGFVKSYYHNYFTTSSNGFNYADDCGSIASTNLFYYWYNRNTKKYKDLYMGSWLNTYKKYIVK